MMLEEASRSGFDWDALACKGSPHGQPANRDQESGTDSHFQFGQVSDDEWGIHWEKGRMTSQQSDTRKSSLLHA